MSGLGNSISKSEHDAVTPDCLEAVHENVGYGQGKDSNNSQDAFQSPMALVVLAAVSVDDASLDEEDGSSSTGDLQ